MADLVMGVQCGVTPNSLAEYPARKCTHMVSKGCSSVEGQHLNGYFLLDGTLSV